MDFSWRPFIDPDPESDLLGIVGELRPFRVRTVPRVLQNTRRIESQLADSNGLVGYSLRANFFRRRFWAVAVWEDEESLLKFVTNEPHAGIMAALEGEMELSQFDRFDVVGEEVPIEIDDAIERVRSK